jgi:hypothetical protein
LIGADRDALSIFLNGGLDNFGHGAVVAQVNDLDSATLEQTANDVDGSVVTIEK